MNKMAENNSDHEKEVGYRAQEGVAGKACHGFGRFQEDIEHLKKKLSIAKEMGDKVGEGVAYCNLGKAYRNLGMFHEAIENHNKHLSITKEESDRAGEGVAYCNLGKAYHNLGKFHEAVEYHHKHLSITKEVSDRAGEGLAYCNLGKGYHHLGQFQKAIEYQRKRVAIAKEDGNREEEGRAYSDIGGAYNSLHQFQEAIGYHKKDLSITKELNDRAGEGVAYCNLGKAYRNLGKFHKALKNHNQHLFIAKEVNDRAGEGVAYGNLGIGYHCLGQFQKAIEYQKKHLAIAKEEGSKEEEGRAYSGLGNAYNSLGRFKEAIEYHRKDLSITKDLNDRKGEGEVYCDLGKVYYSLGEFQEAIDFHNKDLSIAKELGNLVREGEAYGNLGNAYHRLEQFQKARGYHEEHLTIAKTVGNRAAEGVAYGNLGNVYRNLGEFQVAIEYHKKHVDIAKEVGDKDGEVVAYGNLGKDYHLLGMFQEALECYQSSVRLCDRVRAGLHCEDIWQISFRNLYRTTYSALWRTLLQLKKIDQALCAAERGRAQTLAEGLKIQYGFTEIPSVSFEPQETISYISNELSTQTVFLGLEENKLYFWFISKGNKVELRKRKIVHSFAALLKTTLTKIGVGDDVRCEDRSLDQLNGDVPSNMEGNEKLVESSHCTKDSLRPLYDAIIGPIADLCTGDELVIVPDGPLCLTPLPALSESIRIRIFPSLTSLKLITDCPEDYHSQSGALLVGEPFLENVNDEWGQTKYTPLPYAKKEVEMIGEILKIPPITGTEATKQEVLKRITSVALVHIATHGRKETGEIALAANPTRKSSDPKEEDYLLKISDMQTVRLRARLVVLSCCHSGRGEVMSEGVVGIARAFLAAGARSVLVALWAINDEATMEFMKIFYQHLADGKSASVSLQQAMKSLQGSEKFHAVKHWAPFLLIGDDVTLDSGENEAEHRKLNFL